MTSIQTLNGKIMIHHVQRLFTGGRYERRLYLSSQVSNTITDLHLTREQVEELISKLQSVLKSEL